MYNYTLKTLYIQYKQTQAYELQTMIVGTYIHINKSYYKCLHNIPILSFLFFFWRKRIYTCMIIHVTINTIKRIRQCIIYVEVMKYTYTIFFCRTYTYLYIFFIYAFLYCLLFTNSYFCMSAPFIDFYICIFI